MCIRDRVGACVNYLGALCYNYYLQSRSFSQGRLHLEAGQGNLVAANFYLHVTSFRVANRLDSAGAEKAMLVMKNVHQLHLKTFIYFNMNLKQTDQNQTK